VRELNELEDLTQQISESAQTIATRSASRRPITGELQELQEKVEKFSDWQLAQRRLINQRKRAYARSLLEARNHESGRAP